MKKNWLALLLAVVMLIGLLTVTAFADEGGEITEEEPQVDLLADDSDDSEITVKSEEHTHVWGSWASNGDGTHSRACECGEKDTANCADVHTDSDRKCDACGTELEKLSSWLGIVDTSDPIYKCYTKGEKISVKVLLQENESGAPIAGKSIYCGGKSVATTGSDGYATFEYTVVGTKAAEEISVEFKGDTDFDGDSHSLEIYVGIPVTKIAVTVTAPKVGGKPATTATVVATPTGAKVTPTMLGWEEAATLEEDPVEMTTSTFQAGMFYAAGVLVELQNPIADLSPKDTGSAVAATDAPGYFFTEATVVTVNGKTVTSDYYGLYEDDSMIAIAEFELPYTVTSGAGSKWAKTSTGTLSFTCDGAKAKFSGIKVDGKLIASSNYTVSGTTSTTVTLTNAYLKTLTNATHKITFVYKIAESSDPAPKATADVEPGTKESNTVNFAVTATANTGDDSMTGMWIAMAGTSACALAAVTVLGKKRREQ